jgi:alcohol dehydrogenase
VSDQFVSSFVWRNPTRIVYGVGKLETLADEVRGIAGDGANVFLVTGRNFLRERGILQDVLDDLAGFSATLHDRTNPFPSPADADAAARHCRESEADVVVAIGGGSALDLAKAAAILATQDGSSRDYMGGGANFENKGLPFIAVPTTSGSSSEVTPGAALWDWEVKNHFGLSSPTMFPDVAIVDPKLAMTMDQNLAANTGMDAFTSAFESYWNVNSEPMSDALALEVIRIYSQNLVRSAIQGDMESRAACALAATMSGVGYSNSPPNACHGIGSPLTLFWNVEHGQAVGISLAPLLRWNARAIAHKMPALLSALGAESVDAACDKITEIMERCGLHTRLSGLGVGRDDIALIVEHSRWERLGFMPEPMTEDELGEMLAGIL